MNQEYPSTLLERAVKEFTKLPGIGRKTATRLVLHLLRKKEAEVAAFSDAILTLKREAKYCKVCHSISDTDVCPICVNPARDHSVICVVENIQDVMAVENTMQYRGVYHVLGGVISPMQGVGPSDLKIDLLCDKLLTGMVKEVIIAISTSVEGETTLFYLMSRLKSFPDVKVTTIARGIGFGDELEYVDELTITHALINRREI